MVRIEKINKSFGSLKVLSNCTYQFEKDTCYVIQGPSGIGKTTLLNLIKGYCAPDSGKVIYSEDESVEYMFQDSMLFSNITVLDNLAIKYYSSRIDQKWNLADVRERMHDVIELFQLEELLNRKVDSISGGEKQRILLANMLLSQSQVLLLDEPVSNLDEYNRSLIGKMIKKLIPDHIVIIVSHVSLPDINEAKMLHLEGGQIIEKEYT